MDIFSHESKSTKKQFDAFLKDRKKLKVELDALGDDPHALEKEQVFKDREKSRSLTKKFFGFFRSKAKEIKAEGRYGDKVASSLYVPRKSAAANSEERRDLSDKKEEFHNEVITLEDYRIAKNYRRTCEDMEFSLGQACQVLNLEEDDATDDIRALSWWMERDDPQNARKMVEDYDKDSDTVLERCIEEVVSYNFSLAMLNPAWLSANTATFVKMTGRAKSLTTLLKENPNYVEKMSKEARLLVNTKILEAEALQEALKADLAVRGQKMDLETGIVDTGVCTRQQVEENNKEAVLLAKKKFKTAKDQELKKLNDLTDDKNDPVQVIENLSYMDFVAMTGTKNRGQVTVKGGKLSIINNGYFCSKKGSPSADNLMIRQRFMDTALMQLDEQDRDIFRPQLMTMLKLYDEGQKESMPLSRATILQDVRE